MVPSRKSWLGLPPNPSLHTYGAHTEAGIEEKYREASTIPVEAASTSCTPRASVPKHPWANLPILMQFLGPAATRRRRTFIKETPDLPATPNHDP